MKLPRQVPSIIRKNSISSSKLSLYGVNPSSFSIPATVALALARDYSIDRITGAHPQCIATVVSILNNYQECVDSGRNVNCENIAARQLAQLGCVYCDC